MTDELRRAMEPVDFTKRTPGPWTLNEVTGTIYRTGYRGWNVAEVVCKPDGPFIAEAPRLLCDRATLQQAVRERDETIERLREALTEIAEITFINDEGDESIMAQPAQCNAIARAILAELPEDVNGRG